MAPQQPVYLHLHDGGSICDYSPRLKRKGKIMYPKLNADNVFLAVVMKANRIRLKTLLIEEDNHKGKGNDQIRLESKR